MEQYYIESTNYSIQQRQIKRGRVYDVYFYVWTIDGHKRQKRLCGFETKDKAKRAHSRFITEHCSLVDRGTFRMAKDAGHHYVTVATAIHNFIASLQNKAAEGGIYDKISSYNAFVIPQMGNEDISSLTVDRLKKWQNDLWALKNPRTGDYYSYNYLCKSRSNMSALLNYIEEEWHIPNALHSIKRPARIKPKQQMQFWTRDQFNQFIDVVSEQPYHTLFMMLYYTGRRKGEILALSPTDVTKDKILITKSISTKNIDGATWKVAGTKNKKTGETFICKSLMKELKKYKPPKGKFYFGGDRPIPTTTLTRKFKYYIQLAGVPEIRIHDLRHSFVSLCFSLGANVTVIADLIGDTIEQVTQTYAHMFIADKKAVIDRIN